jgi:hypothetical protein
MVVDLISRLFAIGVRLLTHAERYSLWNDLVIF